MIITATEADGLQIRDIAARAGVFSQEEVECVGDLWEDYLSTGPVVGGYNFLVDRDGDQVLGFACYGPRDLTSGVFDLYWIAVEFQFSPQRCRTQTAGRHGGSCLPGRRAHVDRRNFGNPALRTHSQILSRHGICQRGQHQGFLQRGRRSGDLCQTLLTAGTTYATRLPGRREPVLLWHKIPLHSFRNRSNRVMILRFGYLTCLPGNAIIIFGAEAVSGQRAIV